MKKIVSLMLLVILSLSVAVTSFSVDDVSVVLDGKCIDFDVKARIVDGRTMVPVRTIFEAMGATVEWDEATNTAICVKGNKTIKFKVNHMDMYVNERVVWMDIPAYIYDVRLLIALRYVAEAFGADVSWNRESNTVFIASAKESLSGKVIVVDAGHGINNSKRMEAIAPNSLETKRAFVSGTSGARQTEEQLNLSVSLKLQKELERKGAIVYMTRSAHQCDVSNIDRALFANNLNADISVKIHADGNNNKSINGVSVLVPGDKYIKDSALIEKSRLAGELILDSFITETGAANRGISVRNDLTGFNWSQVPIVLVELGFMSNPTEDKLMETEEYQNKMVAGIVMGLEKYFEN